MDRSLLGHDHSPPVHHTPAAYADGSYVPPPSPRQQQFPTPPPGHYAHMPSEGYVPPGYAHKGHDRSAQYALLVFIVGFLCCPVWCAGWSFVRNENQRARLLGISSVCLAIIAMMALATAFILFVLVLGNDFDCNTNTSNLPACFSVSDCELCMWMTATTLSTQCQTSGLPCDGHTYSSVSSTCSSLTSAWACTSDILGGLCKWESGVCLAN
eukprot:TRINITY_DN5651_c0_g1_i1.p1 TRINITY_DN5651_c0_g1~~TRINITY_DN5651_c0_g1_i1.p1  ORF type:complete len:212 (+),score=18.92 TRINITY_DN5651_c0_g1_i1:54-689(+)